MMSNSWSWYVIVLVVVNILAMLWLLLATSKSNDVDDDDTMGHEWDGIQELNNPLPRWWYGLFLISIIWGFAYLYLYPGLGNYEGSLGWSQTSQFEQNLQVNRGKQDAFFAKYADSDIPELATNVAAMETGQRLFLNNCATCHGSAGQGAKGFPNLSDDDWMKDSSAATIYSTIENGRDGMMPNLGINKANSAILAQYVQSLSGAKVTDYVSEKGPALFQICAACHGPDGKGNKALGAPNLTDDIWMHGATTAEIRHVIENGVQANMPKFKQLLSPSEIKLLAAYVLSLQGDS
jgi:cytochrome c oxidase cbb3-type subunit 3